MQPRSSVTRTADGRELCFAEWGEPKGRVVFSLHGTPGCRLPSAPEVEFHLEELLRSLGVRLITYDRPGYGRSDRHPGRRVVDSAADVLTIADVIGVDRFAIEGGCSGSAHARAAAALLPGRITRLALVAPMAPYHELGQELWSAGQAQGVREYVSCCLEGEARLTTEVAREDAEMRAAGSANDPKQAQIFEQTVGGLWGWVDDELAAFKPWGFDVTAITAPTTIWYDPDETVLPRQHAEWLGTRVSGATLVNTRVLGHEADGNPTSDWSTLYSWLRDFQP